MTLEYLPYLLPVAGLIAWHQRRNRRVSVENARVLADAREAGLVEPASLHPVIDATRCIGCGACVRACPEQPEHQVLGLIDGKARLIGASDCIGHGACRTACPEDAIALVFGTEKRGVEIPLLTPQFETSVPGIFIAGELGGMGLIRNALSQGRQAIDAIAERGKAGGDFLDVVIVGAGPAGFSASLAALSRRMRYVTLEQDSLGGCVFQYPRGKVVMTAPADLPLVGKVRFGNTTKEELLAFWQDVERKTGVQIRYRHRVETIERIDGGFLVQSDHGAFRTRAVLLAVGRRGTPRRLGVEGEQLPKVVYRLIDPEQYAGKHVLVVGGGDSAIEAAVSLSSVSGTTVALSHRGEAITRAKPRNRTALADAAKAGRLRLLLNSTVRRIEPDNVVIDQAGHSERLANDAVIVNAGGVLPSALLEGVGVAVELKRGTA